MNIKHEERLIAQWRFPWEPRFGDRLFIDGVTYVIVPGGSEGEVTVSQIGTAFPADSVGFSP